MERIFVNAGGTYGFMAEGDCLRKVTLATGVSTTLTTGIKYKALCYGGDSVLYGADSNFLYSIHQTTGAATKLAPIRNIDSIIYKDLDEVWVTSGNSYILVGTAVDTATGTVAVAGGGVTAVTITNDGYYNSGIAPLVTITSTSGANATGVAILNASNKVAEVAITEPGTGYTEAAITFGTGTPGEYSFVKQTL